MKPTREQVLHELLVNSDYAKMADAIMALYEDKPCPEATHPQTPCPACGKVGYWTAYYHKGGGMTCDCQKPPKWEEDFWNMIEKNKMVLGHEPIRDFIREKLNQIAEDFNGIIGSRHLDEVKRKWGL
ncbi:MAG TPA: hypothetical protein PLL10_00020 [Elusimicrobiales bacterium]|nr:hypothetical protein [Elusimicrobiales bacterium]